MKTLRHNYDLAILLLVVAAFVFVAAQRLGSSPLPDDGDESMTLQVPYEIIHRGNFGWPMYRYLGGNIENTWHSLRPVYYLMLTGFFKLFGFGLLQGRAFNLTMAVLVLLLVYVIGRRLFSWTAGLVAVLMLVSDPMFMERARMVRHDYAAAMFALLAFLLFEVARERRKARFYVASGLAAGAGVMCHTNCLYILVGIVLLMVFADGFRIFTRARLYQFFGGALAVMAYEIVSDILDYRNLLLQYRGDKAHFSIFSISGWWENLGDEITRYSSWYSGELIYPRTSLALLHLFQLLSIVAIVYLSAICVRRIKNRHAMIDPRVRILIVTLSSMIFLALTTNYKRKYVVYMVHLTPWFAMCVGILFYDAAELIKRLRRERWQESRLFDRLATATLAVLVLAYGALLVRQDKKYLSQVKAPDSASFDEFASVLRSVVPEGLCPTSFLEPVFWLAFPEADHCYSTIEGRMMDAVDVSGKDYALIVAAKHSAPWMRNPEATYHLIGAMDNTRYGDLRIYYTGVDPRYLVLKPTYYRFFYPRGGYTTESPADVDRRTEEAKPEHNRD